jgi:RNA polymerase sigma-54 factor
MQLKQEIKLQQTLQMTPELQQAIKLLQLSTLELVQEVSVQLQENPALELEDEQEETVAPAAQAAEEPATNLYSASDDLRQAGMTTGEETGAREPESVPASSEEIDFDRLLEKYSEFRPTDEEPRNRSDDDDMPSIESRTGSSETLTEHLLWQLQMGEFSLDEELVAREIIGNLEDDGYLRDEGIQAVMDRTGVSPQLFETVLPRVQRLDPVGVAARDLRECLLVQAQTAFPLDSLLHLVITTCLDEIVGRAASGLAQKLGVPAREVKRVVELIGNLDPKPAKSWNHHEPEYIVPDMEVFRDSDGKIVVDLNESGLPKLRISGFYRSINTRKLERQDRDYIRDKIRSAEWLVRSIYQRQSTMKKVAEAIFNAQSDFLELGEAALRPLKLHDVAQAVDMHESTISRVTTNKYAQTPRGIFELKYFFGSRIKSSDGEDKAGTAIKSRIKALVQGEDRANPLSDQTIVEVLAQEGISIARRTVAKYRQQLGFPSSSDRIKVL